MGVRMLAQTAERPVEMLRRHLYEIVLWKLCGWQWPRQTKMSSLSESWKISSTHLVFSSSEARYAAPRLNASLRRHQSQASKNNHSLPLVPRLRVRKGSDITFPFTETCIERLQVHCSSGSRIPSVYLSIAPSPFTRVKKPEV